MLISSVEIWEAVVGEALGARDRDAESHPLFSADRGRGEERRGAALSIYIRSSDGSS